jgi:AcrR family transcriptional regulator
LNKLRSFSLATTQQQRATTPTSKSGRGGAAERILASAAELFANFGYNGVSTRDIASGAGVNEVTIYRHYPRKRDLYLAVVDAELQQVKLRGDLLTGIAEADNGRTALQRSLELIAATLMHRPQLLRLMQFSTLELGEDIDPMLRRHLGQLVEVVAHYLEPWAGRGELRGGNTKAVVLALIAIVVNYGPLHRLFLSEGSGIEAVFSAYSDFCRISVDEAGLIGHPEDLQTAKAATE